MFRGLAKDKGTMNIDESRQIKEQAIALLRERVPAFRERLAEIDYRIPEYLDHLCNHSSAIDDDENDLHCCSELLCALKVLRLIGQYILDVESVKRVLHLREGDWHREGQMWVHDRGGIRLPGTGSAKNYYRWEPFQTFIWLSIYGIKAWVDTEVPNGTRALLPTEREGEAGTIEDLRRICTDFTYYAPRKCDKTTGVGAYDNVLHFMLGDQNAEIYCTANSQTQSKLIYSRTQEMLRELDPQGRRIRFTAATTNWKPGQFRSAQLWALSAGGRTKDGLFASKACVDEYGSAAYINGKSDMGSLVSVVQSSMGPRREPLTMTTTTAGNVSSGPFVDKLDGMKRALALEIHKDIKPNPRQVLLDPSDRWAALMFEPDLWERDEEYLFTSKRMRRKVNPMLGIIVQHAFYDDEIAKARLDPQKKLETITKLFNVYQSDQVKDWVVTGDKIRQLQENKRITDCLYVEGWDTFVGLDFGGDGDLFAITYLSVNKRNQALSMQERFFADTEAWVSEYALNKSPNRPLFEKWIEQGWLHVCPGEVFNPDLAINSLMSKNNQGVNLTMFGFDPAQSKQPINTLKAWLQSLGIDMASIQNMVIPVSQNYMTTNPLVGELEYMTIGAEPWLRFSNSPLWPWCFGNCQVVESKENLRKLLKSGAENKVDPVHALMDALYCFDLSEGRLQ